MVTIMGFPNYIVYIVVVMFHCSLISFLFKETLCHSKKAMCTYSYRLQAINLLRYLSMSRYPILFEASFFAYPYISLCYFNCMHFIMIALYKKII